MKHSDFEPLRRFHGDLLLKFAEEMMLSEIALARDESLLAVCGMLTSPDTRHKTCSAQPVSLQPPSHTPLPATAPGSF